MSVTIVLFSSYNQCIPFYDIEKCLSSFPNGNMPLSSLKSLFPVIQQFKKLHMFFVQIHERAKKKKTLFENVHDELCKLIKRTHKHDHKTKKSASMSETTKPVFKHRPPPPPPSDDEEKEEGESSSHYDYPTLDVTTNRSPSTVGVDDEDIYIIPETAPNENKLKKTSSVSSEPPRTPITNRPLPSVPTDTSKPNYLPMTASSSGSGSPNARFTPPGSDVDSQSSNSNDGVFMPANKPEYVKITQKDMGKILGKGQTAEDFYRLGVAQLSHLLFYCNLSYFGEVCCNQNLDGAFFKDTDLNILKEDPFNGTVLDVKKFEKVISGWRPNFD